MIALTRSLFLITAASAALAACGRSEPADAPVNDLALSENVVVDEAVFGNVIEPDNGMAIGNAAAPAEGDNAAAPATGDAPADTYRMVGTEPFWGGTIAGTRVHYTTMENQSGWRFEAKRSDLKPGYRYEGTLEGKPFTATIRPGSCSDGMSDRTFAFTAELQVMGETRRGCASAETAAPAKS